MASGGYASMSASLRFSSQRSVVVRFPGVVRRQDQLGHQLDASLALAGLQEVLDGQGGGAVGLVPVGGPEVQLLDHVGFDPLKLAEQELAEEGVVAVPVPLTVQRNEELASSLEISRDAACAFDTPSTASHSPPESCSSTAVRRRNFWSCSGRSGQRFAVEVVGHVAVVAGDRERLALAVPGDQRGEVHPGRPALCSLGDDRGERGGDRHVRGREHELRTSGVQREVAHADFELRHRTPAAWAGAVARSDWPRRTAIRPGCRRGPRSTRRGTRASGPRGGRPP